MHHSIVKKELFEKKNRKYFIFMKNVLVKRLIKNWNK